jgi:hypothetical protein
MPHELFKYKLRAYSHTEYINEYTMTEESSLAAFLCLAEAGRQGLFVPINYQKYYPDYLRPHLEKIFPNYIEDV